MSIISNIAVELVKQLEQDLDRLHHFKENFDTSIIDITYVVYYKDHAMYYGSEWKVKTYCIDADLIPKDVAYRLVTPNNNAVAIKLAEALENDIARTERHINSMKL